MPANPKAAHGSPQASAKANAGRLIEKLGQGMMGVANKMTVDANNRLAKEQREQEKYDNALARQKEMMSWDYSRERRRYYKENFKLGLAKEDGEGKSVYDKFREDLRAHYQQTTEGMTPQQKAFYQPGYDQIRKTGLADLDSYVARQTDAYFKAEKTSQIAYREDLAIDARENIDDIAAIQVQNALDIRSLFKGESEAYIKEKIQNSNDRVHNGVVASYLRDGGVENLKKAWVYFNVNSEEMSAKVRGDTKAKLQKASTKYHAENYADSIEIEDYSYQEKLAAAKRVSNPHVNDEELQTAVTKILVSREKDRKQRQKQALEAKYDETIGFIMDVEGATPEERYARSAAYIEENYQSSGENQDRLRLLKQASNIHRRQTQEDDPGAIQELAELEQSNPSKFIETDLQSKFGARVKTSTLNSYIKSQEKIRAGQSSVTSETTKILSGYREMGYQVDKNDPSSVADYRQWQDTVQTEIDDFEELHKRSPSLAEFNEILKNKQVEKVVKGIESGESVGQGRFGLYDPDETYKQAKEKGRDQYWLPDLNDQQKAYFKTLADSEGVYDSSKDFVLRMYARDEMGIPLSDELKLKVQEYKK